MTETSTTPEQRSAGPRGVSGGTVVWGLVLLAVALLAGGTQLLGWVLEPVLALSGLLLGAGVLLVLFAAFGGRTSRRARRAGRSGPAR